jgi:hypothetical protein
MGRTMKSISIDRDRKAIAGIQKHYGSAPEIVLHGESFAPADVMKILQDQIDGADAVAAAKAAFHRAVAAQHAADAEANALFLALKTRVMSDFKNRAEVLAEMGMSLPQKRTPDVATMAEAAAKRAATRKARHTMGPRQKAKIKGSVTTPATTPKPDTHD